MKLYLKIWRQAGPNVEGHSESVDVGDAVAEMSILELLDHVNSKYVEPDKEPFALALDCRKGICGTCGLNINGRPHGPGQDTPTCQQHLHRFNDDDTLKIEPIRSAAYPVIKNMVVDRSALGCALKQGGHVSIDAGIALDVDTLHLSHETAEFAPDHVACIGCGACVAACPNGAAYLFTGAKLVHLSLVSLGREERGKYARKVVDGVEGTFGPRSLYSECAGIRPAGIPLTAVVAVTKERARSFFRGKDD